MELYKFQSQVGTDDAYVIRARQLDDNFSRLQPQSNGTYGINETANGWSLNIFPAYPQTAEGDYFLAYTQGGLDWVKSEMSNPPSGTPGWREVERCDGKTMYVWGTEWETPA